MKNIFLMMLFVVSLNAQTLLFEKVAVSEVVEVKAETAVTIYTAIKLYDGNPSLMYQANVYNYNMADIIAVRSEIDRVQKEIVKLATVNEKMLVTSDIISVETLLSDLFLLNKVDTWEQFCKLYEVADVE